MAGRPAAPFFEDYAARKATAGQPGPSLRIQHFQRLAVALSAALQQADLRKAKARQMTAKTLTGAGLLGRPTAKVVERLELRQPPLSEQDLEAIRGAVASFGADPGCCAGTSSAPSGGLGSRPANPDSAYGPGGALIAESQHARIPAMNEIRLHTQLPQPAGKPVPAFFGRRFLRRVR